MDIETGAQHGTAWIDATPIYRSQIQIAGSVREDSDVNSYNHA